MKNLLWLLKTLTDFNQRTSDHSDHNEKEDDNNADDVGLGEELDEIPGDVAARLLVPAKLAILHTVAP